MVGRPRKYKEKLQNISIALEPTLILKLEGEADEQGISRNEYFTSLIISSDKKLSQTLLKEYSLLKAALKQQQAITKTYMQELEKIQNKSMSDYLFEPIEDIPELNPLILQYKEQLLNNAQDNEKWKQGLLTEQPLTTKVLINNLADIILRNFTDEMLKQGKMIKQKKIILAVIKKKLFDLLSSFDVSKKPAVKKKGEEPIRN